MNVRRSNCEVGVVCTLNVRPNAATEAGKLIYPLAYKTFIFVFVRPPGKFEHAPVCTLYPRAVSAGKLILDNAKV